MPKSFLYIFRTYSRTFKDRGDNPVDITSEYLFNFESFDDTKIGTTNEVAGIIPRMQMKEK